mmetsp:Transcript_100918/g.323917  ORF Transcript_100918/g.323917 Transcript_100918/m.323917 type:complete len:200 (+) Transcript_100918:743-1342(+)
MIWVSIATSMQSSTQNSIHSGKIKRQGFSKYCLKRCCLGLSSLGCTNSTGNKVTHPKRIPQMSHRITICASSSSKARTAHLGPPTASAQTSAPSAPSSPGLPLKPKAAPAGGASNSASASAAPKVAGTGRPDAAPAGSSCSASMSLSSWLAWKTSVRTQSVTLAFVSSACMSPTSACTSLTATIAAPKPTRSVAPAPAP